jgi:hypothetical protein
MVLTERQVLTEQTVKDGVTATVRTEDIVGGYVLIIKVGDKETHNNSLWNNTNGTNGINNFDGKMEKMVRWCNGLPGINGKMVLVLQLEPN